MIGLVEPQMNELGRYSFGCAFLKATLCGVGSTEIHFGGAPSRHTSSFV